MTSGLCIYLGEELARYGFGEGHPFGVQRYNRFVDELERRELLQKLNISKPVIATEEQLGLFHTPEYIGLVKKLSLSGEGYLDAGDTPAFVGMFEAASTVVGTVLAAANACLSNSCKRAFVPIAGLHHARREGAAGFSVFNDCGVAIEWLLQQHGLSRVAYVDIDAHHGDGVFYGFEDDPRVFIADMHEDGRYLYPGSGTAEETGRGSAEGTKLNIPMPPGADDKAFLKVWEQVESYLLQARPQIILLQCGVDSLAGDPITHLKYSSASHIHAIQRLRALAEQCCAGRLLVMGGGGYNLDNIAQGWGDVVEALL